MSGREPISTHGISWVLVGSGAVAWKRGRTLSSWYGVADSNRETLRTVTSRTGEAITGGTESHRFCASIAETGSLNRLNGKIESQKLDH
jgi:hypothetical protein